MQTFLPYPDFHASAAVLDYKRLGKQRVETWQILQALDPEYVGPSGKPSSWRNHPATKMWRGHELALVAYGAAVCAEWKQRGYNDTMFDRFMVKSEELGALDSGRRFYPEWFGDEEFHRSHQSNLVRKDAEFYAPKFPDVTDDLLYIWPQGDS